MNNNLSFIYIYIYCKEHTDSFIFVSLDSQIPFTKVVLVKQNKHCFLRSLLENEMEWNKWTIKQLVDGKSIWVYCVLEVFIYLF